MFVPKDQIKRFDEFEFGATSPVMLNGHLTTAVVTRLGVCTTESLPVVHQNPDEMFKHIWDNDND